MPLDARAAGLEHGVNTQTASEMNALFTAYAALEALVLETAATVHPALYVEKREFRRVGILDQYKAYLEADGRKDEDIPAVVEEINEHRHRVGHGRPTLRRCGSTSGDLVMARHPTKGRRVR